MCDHWQLVPEESILSTGLYCPCAWLANNLSDANKTQNGVVPHPFQTSCGLLLLQAVGPGLSKYCWINVSGLVWELRAWSL